MTYEVDHSVQVLEAALLEHARVHVILKVAIVERQTDAVQLQASEELGVLLGEMVLEPFVEEVFVVLLAKHAQHGLAVLAFVAGVAGDEVFHAECASSVLASRPIWWLKHIGMQGQRYGWGVFGHQTHFIQPPIAVPRKITCWPLPSTILSPDVFKMPVAILTRLRFGSLGRGVAIYEEVWSQVLCDGYPLFLMSNPGSEGNERATIVRSICQARRASRSIII